MNNKGFTIIELLAVLIVLSIILVIAVPRVLNIIETSKKKSFEVSANKLIKEAAKEFAKDNLEKEYIITNGSFEGNKLDVKGDMPLSGTINILEDGKKQQ